MLKEWCSGPAPPLRNTMQSVVWIKNRGLFSAARAGPQDARQQKEFRQRVCVAPTKMQTGFFAWNLLYICVVVVLWIQLDKRKKVHVIRGQRITTFLCWRYSQSPVRWASPPPTSCWIKFDLDFILHLCIIVLQYCFHKWVKLSQT